MNENPLEHSGGYYLLAAIEPPHEPMYFDLVLRHLRAHGSQFVLDAGCGDGNFTAALKGAGISIVGLDGSPNAVARAKGRHPGIPFICGSVYDDFRRHVGGQRFDAIVAVEVIEHLFSPAVFLDRAHEALTDNGLLIITTPYWGYLKNILLAVTNRMDRALSANWEGGHIKHFSYQSMRTLFDWHGFDYVAFHGAGRNLPFCWRGMMMVARKRALSQTPQTRFESPEADSGPVEQSTPPARTFPMRKSK